MSDVNTAFLGHASFNMRTTSAVVGMLRGDGGTSWNDIVGCGSRALTSPRKSSSLQMLSSTGCIGPSKPMSTG